MKTHSHKGLHNRIIENRKVDFNSRQHDFLDLISEFYNKGRYNNYLVDGNIKRDILAVKTFLDKHVQEIQEGSYSENLDRRKEILGRIIGSIVKSYYNVIQKICSEKNIYTEETRYDSKAFKIFLSENPKNSLININKEEVIAVKELLIYLANLEESNEFIDFLRNIEPLNIDVSSIKDYLHSISIGKVPQHLINEIRELYSEENIKDDIKNRLEQLDAIGNR